MLNAIKLQTQFMSSNELPQRQSKIIKSVSSTLGCEHALATDQKQKIQTAFAALRVDALPNDLVELAAVVGAWGVHGGIKLTAFSSNAEMLQKTQEWYLICSPQSQRKAIGLLLPHYPLHVRVKQLRAQGSEFVALLHQIDDRDVAYALRGAVIAVPRGEFEKLPENEFYWVDLIGLEVRNRQNELLGKVQKIFSNGPQSVLVVQALQAEGQNVAKEHLIPFVAVYIDAVDMAAQRIQVDWGKDY